MFVPWTRHVDQRFNRLEAAMADVDKALTDLAEAVQKIGTNLQDAIARVNEDVAELQRQVAEGNPAKLQEVADAIGAKVAELGGVADTLAAVDPVKPAPPPVP